MKPPSVLLMSDDPDKMGEEFRIGGQRFIIVEAAWGKPYFASYTAYEVGRVVQYDILEAEIPHCLVNPHNRLNPVYAAYLFQKFHVKKSWKA